MTPKKQPAKECTCEECHVCKGSGNLWFNWRGVFIGASRTSDHDEMETCDNCHGRGIEALCDFCAEELYEEENSEV